MNPIEKQKDEWSDFAERSQKILEKHQRFFEECLSLSQEEIHERSTRYHLETEKLIKEVEKFL